MPASARLPPELLLLIMYLLAPPELHQWRLTCRAMRQQVISSKNKLWNIYVLLAPFFGNIDDFRCLQARTGLLISGSVALQFLARTYWGPSDLDLYVGDLAAFIVIDWLINDGYTLFHRSEGFLEANPWLSFENLNRLFGLDLVESSDSYFLRPGQILFKFRKGDKFIDLIVSYNIPFSSILEFHSTAVMNFISATHAFSLFPRATFWECISLVLRCDAGRRMREVLAKYERRGFKITYLSEASTSFASGPRWLRDHKSTDPVVYGRSAWLQELKSVDATRASTFWSTRQYDLSEFRCDRVRLSVRPWYYSGWEMVQRDGIPEMVYSVLEFKRSNFSCCTPKSFAEQLPAGSTAALEDEIVAFSGISL